MRFQKKSWLLWLLIALLSLGLAACGAPAEPPAEEEPPVEENQPVEIPASNLVVNQFPAEGEYTYEIDKLDQFGTFYTGMWEGTVPDTERTYKIYVPADCRRDASCYFIAVPDAVNTCDFLAASGWIDIADTDKVVLCVFEPAAELWGDAETEAAYFKAAYSQFSGTTYVYHDIFNWRWVGYGAGGALMQRHLMANPMTCAAVVIFNGSETIDAAYMKATGETAFAVRETELSVKYNEAPVPIWILSDEVTANTQAVIDYWKYANDVTEDKIALADGYQYNQKPFSARLFTYDQKVGTVRVSEGQVDVLDAAVTQAAYDFVNLYARSGSGSPYSNSLTRSIADDFFIHEVHEIDGYQREWYVSLPSSYDPDGEPLPMVIFYHGTGQTGLLSMRQGDWWKVGESQGFITVCPSGTLELARSPKKIPQMSWNVEDYGNADDIVFTAAMIEYMAANYNVDLGRVYATGQSNGGRMSIYAGLALPKMITAVASAGASSLTTGDKPEEYFLPADLDESYIVPFMATLGQYDVANFDLTDPTSDSSIRCGYFCQRYGLDFENYNVYSNGRNDYTYWFDEDGIPLQSQVIIGLRAHSHRPIENWLMWNDWFALFSRDPETGTLYYMDKAVD